MEARWYSVRSTLVAVEAWDILLPFWRSWTARHFRDEWRARPQEHCHSWRKVCKFCCCRKFDGQPHIWSVRRNHVELLVQGCSIYREPGNGILRLSSEVVASRVCAGSEITFIIDRRCE